MVAMSTTDFRKADFTRSPQLLKGALVVFATKLPVPINLITFQYNPETMTRMFSPGESEDDPRLLTSDPSTVLGPPIETFDLTVELDAVDALEGASAIAANLGVHPALAALELLVYPPSPLLVLNRALAKVGISMITPAEVPIVLFVWGRTRVVPVRVTSVMVTELAYDERLNPIQASVALSMAALTDLELQRAGIPWNALGIVNQVAKETAARLGVVRAALDVRGLAGF
jgi:hypothetical protein